MNRNASNSPASDVETGTQLVERLLVARWFFLCCCQVTSYRSTDQRVIGTWELVAVPRWQVLAMDCANWLWLNGGAEFDAVDRRQVLRDLLPVVAPIVGDPQASRRGSHGKGMTVIADGERVTED